MLKRAPDLRPDMFNTGSIEIISNMTVYEEDAREDGLQILATLMQSSEDMQCLRTVAFVRTVWDDSSSPFYSLVGQFIPGLVEVAMNADLTDVRQPALRLTKDVWAREFSTEIRSAIPRTLSAGLDSPESGKRCHIVTDLSELLKDDSEKPPYAFAWHYTSDLVVDVFPVVFEKIVRAAIHDDNSSIREKAKALLKDLSRDGRVSSMLKVDALTWLETAAVQPSWWVRHSAVLVSETFIDQLDLTNEDLVKKLVEWAGTDEDDVIRRSSVRLISTICKDHNLSPEMLEVVKSTILSVKGNVIKEGNTTIRSQWVYFLSDMVNYVSFPEVVPILLELYFKVDSDSEVWKNSHEYFLMLGEHENEALKESVDKVLRGIAKDVRDGIEAKPPSKPVETDSDTQETPAQDETEDDDAMNYMSQSTLKLQLRRLLYKVGWVDRSTWVDILATIAAHFPRDFQDAYTILFQIAQHDPDTDVQYACLESLILLTKQPVTRELISDTINHFGDFSENSDWRVRFSYIQLLSSVGVLKEVDLSDEVLKKLSTPALLDADNYCHSEAVNTFSNLLEIGDSDRDSPPRERYRGNVETMVKGHFPNGIVDRSWKIRQSWIRLAGTQVKDAEFPELFKLFNASIKDVDSNVQAEAMKVLQRLLEDGSVAPLILNIILLNCFAAKLRASIAAKLGKSLGSCLSAPEYTDRAVTVLKKITAPPSSQEEACSPYFNVVESQALPKLIEVVVKEEPSDTTFGSQDALYTLFQNVKLPDPIDSILPKAIRSALKLDAPFNVRSAAVNLFGRLIGCVPGRGDSQIISRLAEIVIKDEFDAVRIAALRVLKAAYKAPDFFRFRGAIKASLSKIIENSLKDLKNPRFRANAVSAIDSLTEKGSNGIILKPPPIFL
ncbi:hypothetical protein EST38_g8458 [Candolleomyces aberdarensis]|uniref:ARM repeat-containing protein n=1 Tax=Candolleomyces aberdarensis TaxID=2316362 RepID=A0A4Q2DFC0_9AGAR|nr:hypothetical protein EST38_g8458 [Candolleomyces aberdarensis]